MCGIFGAVGCDLPDQALRTVLRVLEHRGPDGNGVFVDEAAQLTFAHTRLTVIDLVTGAQPLHSADGNLVLVCNGEIYDFERIRAELEAKGYRFATNSDSEVILYLYQEFGLDCFEHLRGEFAFLLYDRTKQLLLAARDRFGIKPLYFSRRRHGFVFASEMKAIFASGLVAPKLDVNGLDPLLDQDPERFRFPFEGIEHVPPASYMLVDLTTQESRIARYWSSAIPAATAEPVAQPVGDAPEQWARLVLKELEDAVRLRLRADVPVGLYLSGGLDSTFVGALMARNMESKLHSFSISFVGSDKTEEEFTRKAASVLGTIHHDLPVTKQMLWDNFQECLWSTELPFMTLAPIGKFLLSQAAKKHVTVALNGQGADEVFLGYRDYFRQAIRDTRRSHSGTGSSVRARRLKMSGPGVGWLGRLSLLLFARGCRAQVNAGRGRGEQDATPPRPLINVVQESRIADMPIDILGFLGDRVEMAHSLEVRVPFLDHKLYDLAKRIPVDFKMRDGLEKAVLRDAGKGVIPEEFRLRPKQGFMFTSGDIDLFGDDAPRIEHLMPHLSKAMFENAGVYSYRTFRVLRRIAKLRAPRRARALSKLRLRANKIILYMMQTHMLHDMYVANPRWEPHNRSPSHEPTIHRHRKRAKKELEWDGNSGRCPANTAMDNS